MRNIGIEFVAGLTEEQFDKAEDCLGGKFPPDLKAFLSFGVPVHQDGTRDDDFPRWDQSPIAEVLESQRMIENALIFDIENSSFWCSAFGERPEDDSHAKEIAIKVIRSWPPLVRVFGHRYMPTFPEKENNPIISMQQPSDTVFYGFNLEDYLTREFDLPFESLEVPFEDYPKIPYWGDFFGLN